jgi:molybdate transport system substrate-binding protein
MLRNAAMTVTLVLAICAAGAAAARAEIRVMSAGAVEEAVNLLAADFTKQGGEKVVATFGPNGTIQGKLAAGEAADIVILSSPAIAAMDKAAALLPGSRAEIGRVGVGVVVRQGAPQPDISTPDAFRKALLDARSVGYTDPGKGASSGIYVAGLLQRLGIADAVNRKATLIPGGRVADHVATGEVELGVHQISEILPVQGVTLVGPLPAELQNYTSYAVAVWGKTGSPEAARAFVAFLTGPAAAGTLRHAGIDPAGRE